MYKVKENVTKELSQAKQIAKNFSELVDASCLAGVAGFAVNEALDHKGKFWYQVLLFAGLVIALQAFVLLVRHFNYSK